MTLRVCFNMKTMVLVSAAIITLSTSKTTTHRLDSNDNSVDVISQPLLEFDKRRNSGAGEEGEEPTTTTAEFNPCDLNPCDRSISFCNVINNETAKCSCRPGYYFNSTTSKCTSGLLFSGILFIVSDKSSPDETTQTNAEDFLTSAYSKDTGYSTVVATELELLTGNWNYELVYRTGFNINQSHISEWFSNFLNTSKLCNKGEDICNTSLDTYPSFQIYRENSIAKAGTPSENVCKSVEGYCEEETTHCESVDGYATCVCEDGYTELIGGERVCTEIICEDDRDCNYPFGKCDNTTAREGFCECIFGMEGNHCNSPWLLVFIVVGGVLLLTTVILTALLTCQPSAKEKTVKSEKNKSARGSFSSKENGFKNYKPGMRAKLPDNYMHNDAFDEDGSEDETERNNHREAKTSKQSKKKHKLEDEIQDRNAKKSTRRSVHYNSFEDKNY